MYYFKHFLDELVYSKNYSNNSIISYKKDVLDFINFLKHNGADHILSVNLSNIRDFIVFLKKSGLKNSSINRKLSSLSTYYSFLYKRQIIDFNPIKHVNYLKNNKKVIIPLNEYEINNLLDSNHIFHDSFEGIRDKLIIDMFYQTGIRRIELINLKDKDINFHDYEIKVDGKGGKQRIIPLQKKILTKIKYYIYNRDSFISKDYNNLFVTSKGKPLYDRLVYNIVVKYLRKVTSKNNISPHILRHTFATHLINRGADLTSIKELLGHSNISTTQIYTKINIERLKKVFEKTHPRSNEK